MKETRTSRAIIVGGSPDPIDIALLKVRCGVAQTVIAVDSGARHLKALDIVPTVVVGDFDSIDEETAAWIEERKIPEERVSPKKNATDLSLALERAKKTGCNEIEIFGVLGGRVDHELVALGDCARFMRYRPVLHGNQETVYILAPEGRESLTFHEPGTTISVIPLMGGGAVVSESKMRWELSHRPLSPLSGHGLSNVILESGATCSVNRGVAAVFVNTAMEKVDLSSEELRAAKASETAPAEGLDKNPEDAPNE